MLEPDTAAYRAPFFLSNAHIQTLVSALLRRMSAVAYERERIPTRRTMISSTLTG